MHADSRLNEILSQWEHLQQQGQSVTPEELCRDTPQLLDDVRRHVDALRGIKPHLDLTAAEPANTVSAPLPSEIRTQATYRNLRRHARGGLGEVLLAWDEELRRDVAVKLMRPGHGHEVERRRRFLREAEITSRLEHPGIVPVYGVGAADDGAPHYAMRLVRGQTLKEVLDAFHKPRDESSSPAGAAPAPSATYRIREWRQLLSHFIGACNAVAYAHSQGVVHRDLKPANIMVGQYGESVVVDWGLAKCHGEADAEETADFLSPEPVAGTQTGAVMGTPIYMSPEQAAGRGKHAGPASDIYSLGATLYTILTGAAPFQSHGGAELLDRVRGGDFRPPRAVKPDVPVALQAICLKAMALRPDDRYSTALDLARDVEHWLADEPVSVHREPWTVRARRWSRRHRTLLRTAGVAGLVVVVNLVVAVVLLAQARTRADQSFQQARQAVDTYFTKVSQSKLGNAPGTQQLRKELLQTALEYYQDFLRQRGDDPDVRVEAADAHRKVARILRETGDLAEAMAAHERGLAIRRQLVAQRPADFAYVWTLADHLKDYGTDLRRVDRRQEGVQALDEAIAIMEGLHAKAPDDDRVDEVLAKAHLNRGLVLGEMSRFADATAASRQGLDVLERCGRRKPDDRQIRYDTATAYGNLANDLADQGQGDQALALFLKGRDGMAEVVRRDQVDKNPDLQRTTEARNNLAIADLNIGWRYDNDGRYPEAAEACATARAGWDALFRENPNVTDYRYFLARSTIQLAYVRFKQKQFEQARQHYEEARGLCNGLVEQEKASSRSLHQLGLAWDGTGIVLAFQDQKAAALAAFERALPLHQRAASHAPGDVDAVFFLTQHYELRGKAHRHWREPEAAAAAARKRREAAGTIELQLYRAATDMAMCIPLVGAESKQLSAAEKLQRERYADEAMDMLRAAVAAGYRDASELRKTPDLEPLRGRADFQKLLESVQ